MRLDFLVRRNGIDTTAETCLHALRVLMGLDVTHVEHGTLWRFDLEDGSDRRRVQDEIARAACRAGRYVNLNRDVYSWLDEPAALPPGSSAADLWVLDGDGRDPVALRYFAPRTSAPLRQVRSGTLYRLWLPTGDAKAAREIALDVAVTRTRRRGLLMNPHAQTLEVLGVWPDAGKEER